MLKAMQGKQPNRIIFAIFIAVLSLAGSVRAQAPDAGYLAGCASFRKGDLSQALEKFSQVLSRNNSDERIYIERGRVYIRMKDYTHAISDFEEANDIVPGISDIWLARTYALSGDQDKALSFLKSHLSSEYRLPQDSIKKDPAFDMLQSSQGWLSLWEKEWYSDAERAAREVVYYQKKGLPDKALSLVNAEIGKSPASAGLFMLRGEVNYKSGNYAASIADYSRALDLKKNNKDPYASLEGIFTLRGMAYLKAERFKDAVADFNRDLKDNPADFDIYLRRAESFAGLKSYDASIRDVLTYLQYFSNDMDAVYQCGQYYFLAGDYISALKYFNRNLKDDPNNGLYYKSRGKTYLKSSTYRYAISDLSMSLDLNPDDSETWMYFGLAKILSGDKENGCSDLEKSRQLGNTEVLKYIIDNCR